MVTQVSAGKFTTTLGVFCFQSYPDSSLLILSEIYLPASFLNPPGSKMNGSSLEVELVQLFFPHPSQKTHGSCRVPCLGERILSKVQTRWLCILFFPRS